MFFVKKTTSYKMINLLTVRKLSEQQFWYELTFYLRFYDRLIAKSLWLHNSLIVDFLT
jgi:hypothetical protein